MNKILLSFIFLFPGFLFSCVSTEKTVYFRDIPANDPEVALAAYNEPRIQKDDILHIGIQTLDGGSGLPAMAASSLPLTPGESPEGYLVDEKGQVSLPMLGTLKVAGLTTAQARELITREAARFYNRPTVQVRFANFKVTVLGEVAKPATYTLPNEKVTLLDALGMAGDLTIYGIRENVLLIRDNEGKKEFIRFNLNSYETFTSPYFYLKQNDVIYVEPGKGKVAANNMARTQAVSITATVISLLTVVLTRVF